MGIIGRVVVSDGLGSKLGKEAVDGLVKSAYSELPKGFLELGEYIAMSLTDGQAVYSIYILNHPDTGDLDFWIGRRGERCPYLDVDSYQEIQIEEASGEDASEQDGENEEENPDEDEAGDESMENWLQSKGIRLPSQSEFIEAMHKDHQRRQDEVKGVSPQGLELRLERVPPFRLRLFQGGRMTHELPLWSLGLVDVLKNLLDFPPFCFENDGEEGIFNGSDSKWVSWSGRQEPG